MKSLGEITSENKAASRTLSSQTLMPDDEDLPATKKDIARLDGNITDLNARMARTQDDLIEKKRDMQTEVLRAFHSWARPVDIRLRSLDERMGLLEERVRTIELGKIN